MLDNFYTTQELMDYLKVSRHTIINYRDQGMPYVKFGGLVRFDINKVNKWIEENNEGER